MPWFAAVLPVFFRSAKCENGFETHTRFRHVSTLDKSTIIAALRDHEAELRSAGIRRLYLFGSYARGTAVPTASDVDLLAEFDGSKRLTLVSLGSLESRLSDLLGLESIFHQLTG